MFLAWVTNGGGRGLDLKFFKIILFQHGNTALDYVFFCIYFLLMHYYIIMVALCNRADHYICAL